MYICRGSPALTRNGSLFATSKMVPKSLLKSCWRPFKTYPCVSEMVTHFYFDSRMYTHLRLDGYPHAFSFARALLVLSYKFGTFTSKSKGKSLKKRYYLAHRDAWQRQCPRTQSNSSRCARRQQPPKTAIPKKSGCTICFSCFSDLIQLETI